jgi:hypothetical protein
MNFHESYGGKGYGCHIGGIKEIPFFYHHIPGYADEKDDPGNKDCRYDLLKFRHGVIITDVQRKNQDEFAGVKGLCHLDGCMSCWY